MYGTESGSDRSPSNRPLPLNGVKFRIKALPIANSTLRIVSQGGSYPILTPASQWAMRIVQWSMESRAEGLIYVIAISHPVTVPEIAPLSSTPNRNLI
jgi:hypothetical protein